MCGIAGILSPDARIVSRGRLQLMTNAIQHRGPDGEGFWLNSEGTVGFGHRRLSIIDLSEAGAQPMHYLDRYTITYNGEIYNYLEIKANLIKKGFSFISHSDTEVILAAYACYGKDCLQYFDGMFAFAIWDKRQQALFCARDRFGEKPFYYHYSQTNNDFVFASEMKSLWAAGVHKKMDNEMLLNYLTLGWVQSPVNKQQTFFEDIVSLPPSHYLFYKLEEGGEPYIELKSYWDIDKETTIEDRSVDFIKQNFIDLFTNSIKYRLRSDVSIGSSISGGLDSSSIVATVNKLLGVSSKQKTFSAVFPGFEKDESRQIEEIVKLLKIENYKVTPAADDFIKDFNKLVYHQEEPFQSSSIYAQYKVYELAKQKGVTVILDGQGADETMGGYSKYYHWYWQEEIAGGRWKEAKQEIEAAKRNGQHVKWGWKNYIAAFLPQLAANQLRNNYRKKQSNHPDITYDFFSYNYDKTIFFRSAVTSLNDILYFNTMQFGLEELLRYADRNSMAHSREVRLPFLSHQLVQFIFSVPSLFKIKEGFTKHLLRISMNDFLPATIVWRKDKIGFEPPQKQWMQHKKVEELIYESRKKLVNKGILKQEILQKKIRPQSAHEADNFDWRYLCVAQCM
ncbi:asparagine synthase (glutamine-hydrolyzing) [Segetibacter koreensis]|uniref:asparagine synthase (glutamine-hydrolyzing) n=1 Tax=Segetibacter koreensis TaxID=398037 RepID=UPI0003619E4B|nr:asparagine synthase (glutamine-hydrolyzing) [Segetibacter koreensis]